MRRIAPAVRTAADARIASDARTAADARIAPDARTAPAVRTVDARTAPAARTAFAAGPAAILALAALLGGAVPPAGGETLTVTVLDARDRSPIGGAFVMVGPGKGVPFQQNTALTSPSGTALFDDAALTGPQTVTAGAEGYPYFSVIESAEGAVTLALHPSAGGGGIHGPTARVTGLVTGIATTSNDGKLDIGIVLPAIEIDAVLAGATGFEAPPDTLDLPYFGEIVLPGNVVIPTQTEFWILQFSKPSYKIDLAAQTTQSLYVVTARLPIDALLEFTQGGDPMDLLRLAEIREFGIERDREIGGGANIPIVADLDLRTELGLRIEGAPSGTTVSASSLGSIPILGGGERTVGYDVDVALADTLEAFLMASLRRSEDMEDVSNFVVATYSDSSAAAAFLSGRIDRAHLEPPAQREVGDFYDPPALAESGARLSWSDVHTPGTEPVPTWTIHSIGVGPASPADTSVATVPLWTIVAPAAIGELALPSLPIEAPGPPAGLVDVAATPEADRLVWTAWAANAGEDLAAFLLSPAAGVTHFSQRSQTLALEPSSLAPPVRRAPGSLRAHPNPTSGGVLLTLSGPLSGGTAFDVIDAAGRRLARVDLPAGRVAALWDGRDAQGRPVAPGVYAVRSRDRALPLSAKVLVIR